MAHYNLKSAVLTPLPPVPEGILTNRTNLSGSLTNLGSRFKQIPTTLAESSTDHFYSQRKLDQSSLLLQKGLNNPVLTHRKSDQYLKLSQKLWSIANALTEILTNTKCYKAKCTNTKHSHKRCNPSPKGLVKGLKEGLTKITLSQKVHPISYTLNPTHSTLQLHAIHGLCTQLKITYASSPCGENTLFTGNRLVYFNWMWYF